MMRTLARLIVIAAFAACGGADAVDPGAADGGPPPRATWHQDIAPIVAEHCQGCHRAGGIAPFPLVSHADAAPIASLMATRVEEGVMPPWSAIADDDCAPTRPWKHDPRLTVAEQELLRVWADDGAAAGDPDAAAPLPEPDSQRLAGVTHTLEPMAPFATSGASDQFMCFILDPELDASAWVTGFDVRPGDVSVVHHAVLTAVPAAEAAAVRAQADADGRFECFSGVMAAGTYPVGVWVPGSQPFELPDGVGIPLPAGSITVMQIHYHPAGLVHEPETTAVELRLVDQAPERLMLFMAAGNAATEPLLLPGPNDRDAVEFRIPADLPDHLETMRFPIDLETAQRFPILSMFPHMHYVGVDLEATIERASPGPGEAAEECLVKSAWNFDWQRTYLYDSPLDELPTIGDGDAITLRCRFDNTRENPFVMRGLADQGLDHPIDVSLGEHTLDEMCLILFGVVF